MRKQFGRTARRVLSGLMAVFVTGAASEEEAKPSQTFENWGEMTDPEHDCEARAGVNQFRLIVPGTLHDLSIEQGHVNAPRVLRDVEGDFVAEVKVLGKVRPDGEQIVEYAYPYHGVGLIVWQDRKNFVRLESAATRQDVGMVSYVNFEQRHRGKLAESRAEEAPEVALVLRLERRANRLLASFREDGKEWVGLPDMLIDFDRKVKVGIAAVCTSTDQLIAEFEALRITGPDGTEIKFVTGPGTVSDGR